MKKTNYFAHKMFAGALALAMMALAVKASAESIPQVITVIRVEGQARYSVDNHSWQPLSKGDVLKPGAVIQTAEKSKVDIVLGEARSGLVPPVIPVNFNSTSSGGGGGSSADAGPKANIVRIYPSSVLAVDKLILEKTGVDEVSDTQLDLRAGKIMGNVKKLSAASRYEVKIPNGVAGIRGTIYTLTSTGIINVLEGQVIVSYMATINGQDQLVTQTVSAGQAFDPFVGPDGNPTTFPSTGKVSPLTPAQLASDLSEFHELNPNVIYTPGTSYTANNTLIFISTSPGQ